MTTNGFYTGNCGNTLKKYASAFLVKMKQS